MGNERLGALTERKCRLGPATRLAVIQDPNVKTWKWEKVPKCRTFFFSLGVEWGVFFLRICWRTTYSRCDPPSILWGYTTWISSPFFLSLFNEVIKI